MNTSSMASTPFSRLLEAWLRYAAVAAGNSIPKAFVNIFVIEEVSKALQTDDPMQYLADRDEKEQPIQPKIQALADVIVDHVNPEITEKSPYNPTVREKPLYDKIMVALKRMKVNNPTYGLIHDIASSQIKDLLEELDNSIQRKFEFPSTGSLMERHDYGTSGGSSVPRGASHVAVLVQRINPKTDTKQWALVSPTRKDKSGKRKVLEWYGSRKPSEERIQKTEKRIQWFSTGPGKKRKKRKKKSRKASIVILPGFSLLIPGVRVSSLYDLPSKDELGRIKAGALFDSLADKLDGAVIVFYDTETTGLTERLPKAQITQISAVAVELPGLAKGHVSPTLVDEYHATSELTEESVSGLDTQWPDKGWTTRQTLDFNRYDLPSFETHRNAPIPPRPADYKSPPRRKTIPYPEYGPEYSIQTKGMPAGFLPEKDMLEGFINFIGSCLTKSQKVILIAHNARFDRKFIAVRCRVNEVDSSVLNSCDNIDSQAFMKIYVEPVINTMDDKTLHDRFKELTKSKPNMFNLDYVNSAFGVLKSQASHTSNVDVEALVKALAKCLYLIRDASELDVSEELRKSVKHRHDIDTRGLRDRKEKVFFKKKFLTPNPSDTEEITELRLQLNSVMRSMKSKTEKAQEMESLMRQIDELTS